MNAKSIDAYFLVLPLLACLLLPRASLWADDRVKPITGTPASGKLTEMTPNEVTIELGQTKKKFAVNEIDTLTFDSEPASLPQARTMIRERRYADALSALAKINTESIKRAEIAQDIQFYSALATARLALSGQGSKSDAGKKLLDFEKAHATSFHYFEACEVLGDLLLALGKFDQAEAYYNKLAAAPWPDYKMRACVLLGRALVGQKHYDRAMAKFDEAIAFDAKGKEADRQRLAARLSKNEALAGKGKTAEAIKAVEEIVSRAEPENVELHARAFNILGAAYRAAGRKKESLHAFLKVDLVYPQLADEHAEALANLVTAWTDDGKPDRAVQARTMLQEKYPDSPWAEK